MIAAQYLMDDDIIGQSIQKCTCVCVARWLDTQWVLGTLLATFVFGFIPQDPCRWESSCIYSNQSDMLKGLSMPSPVQNILARVHRCQDTQSPGLNYVLTASEDYTNTEKTVKHFMMNIVWWDM